MTAPTPTAIPRKLGPGSLTIGAPGSALDFAGRCTSAGVKWKVDTEDDVDTLDWSTIAGDRTYTATLEATIYQDDLLPGPGGLVHYSWTNKGSQVPFTYTPYDTGMAITGELIVDPIDVGGDVKKKNTSDLKWGCVGEPQLVDDLS